MIGNDTGIPSSLLEGLERLPADRPVALLLRHAERKPILPGNVGHETPLTQWGAMCSYELGVHLRSRLKTLRTSPLLRCVQTAEGIYKGAEVDLEIQNDRLLGDPGIFVEDPQVAWTNWQNLGNEGVMRHMATADHALPGMAHPDRAARKLIRHMLAVAGQQPGVHAFITHDVLLSATTARILGIGVHEQWPQYLEGAYFWCDQSLLVVFFRLRKFMTNRGKVVM
jgi:broad specificity phosphatase PhoE